METIIVKSLKRVANGNMLVIGVNGNREATMNAKWQSQEMDFIEKDVGVGGNFKGELQQKGEYLNVTKVDMSSANKATGDNVAVENIEGEQSNMSSIVAKLPEVFLKDDKITAAVLLKGAVELTVIANKPDWTNEDLGQYLNMCIVELHGAYMVALNKLK